MSPTSTLLLFFGLVMAFPAQAQTEAELENQMNRLYTKVENNLYSNPDSSIYYANQLLALSTRHDKKLWITAAYEGLGYGYFYKDNLDQALRMFIKQRDVILELEDEVNLSLAYMNIANVESAMGKYKSSIENYISSQRLLPATEEYYIDRAYLNYNIASTFMDFEDYANTKIYLDRATTYARLDTVRELYRSLNSLEAQLLVSESKYSEARALADSSLKDSRRENDLVEEIYALDLLARIALEEEKFDQAKDLQNEALGLAHTHGDPYTILIMYVDMGNILLKTGNEAGALEYARKAEALRKDQRSLVAHKKSARLSALAREANGYPEGALHYFKEYMAFSDSLKKVNIKEDILVSEKELIEQSNKLLAEKSSLQAQVIQRNNLLMLVMAVALLLCAVAFIITAINVRKRKKSTLLLQGQQKILDEKTRELASMNENLASLNKGKDKLLSIMTHDIKQPFNQTLGALEIMALQNSDPEMDQLLRDVKRSVENDKKAVENLLIWSKSQFAKISARPMSLKPSIIAANLQRELQQSLQEKELNLLINMDEDTTVYADPYHLEIILRNLLTNAVKFSHTGGTLELSCKGLGEKVEIAVSDNGIGMSPEQLNSLFDLKRHFSEKGTLNEAGTGLGMLIVFDFVKENKGEINVESKPLQGSVFKIKLPAA